MTWFRNRLRRAAALLRSHVAYVAVPAGYYLGAKFGVLYTVMPEGTAIVWPPNSVLLAALLLREGRGFLPLALLVLVAELLADVPAFTVVEALLFGLINVGEAGLACALLRASGFDSRFATLADVRRFLLAGPILAAFVAALLGAAVYSHFRGGEVRYGEFVRVWWFGDALGLLVFTPLLLCVAERINHAAGAHGARIDHARRIAAPDLAALALVAAALVVFLLASDGRIGVVPVPTILLLPFAILVAARGRPPLAMAAAAAVALTVVYATTRGQAPFGPLAAREAVIRGQEFVLVVSVVTLGLSVLLSQLRARSREVEAANQRLEDANRQLELRVQEKTARLEALNRELRQLASVDPLTGLMNRRAFFEHADREFDNSVRHSSPLAVLMLDVDHFKAINDRYGHHAGDGVLQHVALAMQEALRSGDVLARYGGEEFVVLAPYTDLNDAAILAARVRAGIERRALPSDLGALRVTVSIGVAAREDGEGGLQGLLKRADGALYEAKRSGRNRVQVARSSV